MIKIEVPQKSKKISCDGNECCFIFNDFEKTDVILSSSSCVKHPKVYFQYNKKKVYCNYCGVYFVDENEKLT